MYRSIIKRSLSDGNILCESDSATEDTNIEQNRDFDQSLTEKMRCKGKGLSESSPEISTCESDMSYSRSASSLWFQFCIYDVSEARPGIGLIW